MSDMSGVRERITQLDKPLPSLIGRLSPVTDRVLVTDAQASEATKAWQTLLRRLLLAQLGSMGLFSAARGSIARWQQQIGLPALYVRWLEESLRILTRSGYIHVEGDVCTVTDASLLDAAAAWSEWEAHRREWSRDPDLRAQSNLVDATLRALPAILSGRQPATSALFPDGSMALVEGVYKYNAVADHFNAVLTDTLVEYVHARRERDGSARLRILEIGAGTGGTTEGVIERLEPYKDAIAEYVYTDISNAFLMHAEREYRPRASYLTCRLFNVEQAPQPQGIEVGAYDVVIATNVLHATKQIRRTLRHAKTALRRRGLLLLNEISEAAVFTHLTFGLLEGWWLYEDEALRIPGTPVLSAETWRRVLEGEGFQSVFFPAKAMHARGQQIAVAESDGLIRRGAAPSPAVKEAPAPVKAAPAPVKEASTDTMRARAAEALKKLVAETIRTPIHRIDESEALEKYGIDSLLVVKLTKGLKEFFPDLSSTILFEYRTIAAVADHLLQSDEAAVRRWVGSEDRPSGDAPASRVSVLSRHLNGSSATLVPVRQERAAAPAPAPSSLEGIAIIGLSGRYPQARTVQEYWENLKAGRNCIGEIPAERWDHRRYFDPQKGKPGKSYSKWGGFIEGIDRFDPLFFRISPKEAEQMDPQERLFLQEAYASIEDAGYTPAGLCASRQVGVYVGVMNSTYHRHASYWSIANRVSYLFDFHGPSMAVDTACSSSLTAIHLAVESLQHGSCDVAIAGGVHLIVDPVQYTYLSAATMLSTGDRCKAFGAQADGFVDGEGVGAVVLKRLDRAVEDGDHIYGVIRSSAVNAGGKTNGYTVPNPTAQRDVVQAALKRGNIDARTVSYVEAHGTGTELGDPIEVTGLTQAYAAHTGDRQYCAIGSVKSNIGHLESAAGIAAVTKVLLQLRAGMLVPSLHSQEPNPHIDFSRTPFRVQQTLSAWERPVRRVDGQERAYPRIAGISSFGAGGANAHVLIEEYVESRPAPSSALPHPAMIVLSAKSEGQLAEQAQRLLAHATSHDLGDSELADMAYTLQVGREPMEHRLAFTARTIAELQNKLRAFVEGRLEAGDIDERFRGEWERWRGGGAVDWAQLYREGGPYAGIEVRRVSLPSYPFARERHWMDRPAAVATEPAPAEIAPIAPNALEVPALQGPISLAPRWEPIVPRTTDPWPDARARVLWVNGTPARREPSTSWLVLAVDDAPSVETIAARIQRLGPIDHVVWQAPASEATAIADEAILQAQAAGVVALYRLIKALLSLGYGAQGLGLSIVTQQTQAVSPGERVSSAHASVHGLVGSLAKEHPRWKVRLIDLGSDDDMWTSNWSALPWDPRGRPLAYRKGVWHQPQLIPVANTPSAPAPAYRPRGVYVVIGGAGHIGLAWSEWVIRNHQAQVIWLGRRPLDAGIQAKLDQLGAWGHAPQYMVADAADADSLRHAYRNIKQAHGRIDGVVLSSAVLEPQALQELTEAQLQSSLRSKIDVSVRVAQVFAVEPLDFVLFFSSVISFIKNPLQSHYAAGCTFADAFAQQWARERTSPVKIMNWGYWNKEGIAGLEEVGQLTRAGIGMIEAPEGMAALDALMSGPLGQVGLIKLTKPLPIEGMNADDVIHVHPDRSPLNAARLRARAHTALAERNEAIAQNVAASATIANEREQMENLLAKLLLVQLRKLGLFQAPASSLAEEKRRLDPRYGRWLEESLRALERRGYLRTENGGWTVTRWPDEAASWQEWEAAKGAWSADADLRSQVQLVGGTLPALPDILSGKRPATDLLFQGASMKQVEGIYRGNARADYFNAVVAEAVASYIEETRAASREAHAEPRPIRILEIGAGTGGTSAAVFERLRAYPGLIGEYCYTDISKAFLLHAESQYRPNHPYLVGKLFNVEEALNGQGIEAGAYDLVIATNVLHATRNIRHTVRNAKAALRRHGMLLLNEMNDRSSGLFIHLTFGLTSGWWRFEDDALRIPGTPGLLPETWRSVLEAEGFSAVHFPAEPGHELGQQVVVAQSDGVAQQRAARTQAVANEPPAERNDRDAARSSVTADGLADRVRQTVLDVLCSSLKLAAGRVDVAASFADYGMDSILGVGFVEALNRALSLTLETTIIFDYSSVTRLSEYIVTNHRGTLAAKPTTSPPPSPVHVAEPEKPLHREPIAIVGIAARFAKSSTPQELWQHLANGDDLVEEAQRWDLGALYAESDRPEGCRHGSFLERLDEFDPLFFNISGTEATFMDPQQRIFLEEAWKALEDAGYAGTAIEGRSVGVYVGCMTGDYGELCKRKAPAQAMWGNAASIIPARISYYLNLQGPAIAIDSACSSSLVAMHLACQGLWSGETELALAGGVAVQSTPGFYLQASNAGMLSATGRCHTFDDRADGFVPGEGAGVVVLKRLREALAAGDHIYGVIRGSGINQDGTTNGITAPSALSQERVEREVYESFGIHPEDIQMVEAHGTGTRLGDPIEYRALKRAFGGSTEKKNYCALGSIKTNVGHTLLAAGVAGVIKILMALKHRQIPPSLHFERSNSQIDFENSPFFVNTTLRAWDVEAGKPRRAAVSSFGFSGTNAHMVIEEAPVHERTPARRPGYLVVLSARTAAQLKDHVSRLVRHCEENRTIDCGNLSYTLLLGRKHLLHRLACVVQDVEGLIAVLRTWLEKGKTAHVFAAVLNEEEGQEQASLKQYGNQCIDECQEGIADARYREHLSTLASLFTQGYRLSFERLFAAAPHSRISLPTYPFAKERYWVDQVHAAQAPAKVTASALHPLLHRNTSTMSRQRFSTRFNGTEFFLDQHIVKGNKVLPGVAYLEMARAAVAASWDDGLPAQGHVVLQNVVWLRPVVAHGDTEVHIALSRDDDGAIDFEIDGAAGLHAQGRALWTETDASPAVDLSVLRGRCTRSIDIATCYATFRAMGIDHGPAYRGLTSVHVGSDAESRRFALARVELPACAAETQSQYPLHPSVMDSVLQAAVGLLLSDSDGGAGLTRPMLPFGLDRLEIVRPSPAAGWVHVRPSSTRSGNVHVPEGAEKVDIDVLDESGAICLRLRGFTSRVLAQESAAVEHERTLLLTPTWAARPLSPSEGTLPSNDGEHRVLLDARYEARLPELQRRWPLVAWSVLPAPKDAEADRMVVVGAQVFAHVQTMLQAEPKRPVLLQVILAAESEGWEIARGLGAMLKSAAQENPALVGQVLAVPPAASAADIANAIEENGRTRDPLENVVRYAEGVRQALVYQVSRSSSAAAGLEAPWKDGGVYWITGGAGGLGLIFAREIASRTKGVTILLTGRSAPSDENVARMAACRQTGAHVEYRVLDVTDLRAVTAFVSSVAGEYGSLNGILHSAGVIRDGFVVRKNPGELLEVLAPKVRGTRNLDIATRGIDLDFLILFSSASAVLGNVGQSDYAMANAFMDGYAARRNDWLKENQRKGRTLAINWPLWAEGGMIVGDALQATMRSEGFDFLDTAAAMDALYRAWAGEESQVAVLAGDRAKLQQRMGLAHAAPRPAAAPAAPAANVDQADLLAKVQGALATLISRDLKVAIEEIQPDAELTMVGFDSVSFTVFSKTLNVAYGLGLSPTIFFEYPTLRSFAAYLVKEHASVLAAKFAVPVAGRSEEVAPVTMVPVESPRPRARARIQAVRESAQSGRSAPANEPIAIVGMSGCFPGANDVNAFWQNLHAEKDCITEIPPSRWDWQAIYGDPMQEANKTNVKWGGFIEGVDEFDPLFFGIAPSEAELMDPAQRLLMTHAWKAIEDAGYSTQSLSGSKTAIFVGTDSSGYTELIAQANVPIEGHSSTGAVASLGPNRMSYLLNLHGPSEPIETACSSSLVAIHRAVRAMQSGDCEMALVGGVNAIATSWGYISFSRAGMLSEDGRCKTFSRHANGYVRGEGVGILFLKKLSAAEKDGDHIYALIRGSAENHGGRASSLTAPNPKAQAEVIKAAYREANIDPRSVTYIETHGTGTSLGDPVEINGLKTAFGDLHRSSGEGTLGEAYCGIGSVKTNIGHLELAAGVAGVIKVLLQLKHRTLVKSLHCEEINPYIQMEGSPFFIVRETQPWNAPQDRHGHFLPRRAGVSSFGFGGVNAHVILEEYGGAPSVVPSAFEHPAIIVLSAKNPQRLREQAEQLLAHLTARAYSQQELASIAYTLQVGRDAMDHRLAFTAATLDDVREKLAAYVAGQVEGCHVGQMKREKDTLALFAADEDLREAVSRWIRRGKYTRLLELWVKGLAVDWSLLHGEAHPPRVSLPTYPFAKERYWIGRPASAPAVRTPPAPAAPAAWLKVVERWVEAPPSVEAGSVLAEGKGAHRVLVLYRRAQDASALRQALAQVWADEANRLLVDTVRLPDDSASVEPLDAYLATHRSPDAIFYFSGAVAEPGRELEWTLLAIQTLMNRAATQSLQFFYCYPHTGTEVQLHQEGLSGLFRAAAMEWPAHRYRTIEYPTAASPEDYVAIVREWAGQSTADRMAAQLPMVRYRDGQRHVTRLVELTHPELGEEAPQLRRGGTYLMVGALGEVGLNVCQELARSHAPRLVILSRRSEDDAELRRRLNRIREAGAQVIHRSVDVSDEGQLASTLNALKPEIGPIHGVFHLARAVNDGRLQNKRFDSFERTIAAKVRGTLNVDKVTRGEPLDFFMVFSSMASFGIEGSADYGYSTAFQNAFVRDRNLRVARGEGSGKSLALCWGQWRTDAYSSEQRDAALRRLGFDLIDATSVVPLMEASLRDHAEVVGIMAVRDGQQVRELYGLVEAAVPKEGFERARRVLLEQSHEQLAALYESLTQ